MLIAAWILAAGCLVVALILSWKAGSWRPEELPENHVSIVGRMNVLTSDQRRAVAKEKLWVRRSA